MKKIIYFLFLATTFASCAKEGVVNTLVNEKNVTLRIGTSASTRASLDPTEEVKNGEASDIEEAIIYFTDGNHVLAKFVAKENAAAHEINLDDLEDGYTFKQLPSQVNSVYVVANPTAANQEAYKGANSVETIEATSIAISDQSAVKTVVLQGVAGLTKKPSVEDENTYEAAVVVRPLVSRFQIKIKKGKQLETMTVEGVYVRNFHMTNTIANNFGDVNNVGEVGNVGNADLFKDTYHENMFSYNANGFALNTTTGAIDKTNKVFGYQFFPSASTSPEIVVRYRMTTPEDATEKTRFARVKGFKNGDNAVEWESGKIYTMTLQLNQGSNNPVDNTISADVTITVAPWVTVALTPDYQ